ncbi:hypothetical protein IWX81_002276 [Salinibacterium sp. CAN_S4]|uniref:S8 family peptidase n=1 Tax=Salinibacterium sp. CAN_S4 TaxID=2787727 RepID=UPI0018EFC698
MAIRPSQSFDRSGAREGPGADDWRRRYDRERPRGVVLAPASPGADGYAVYPTAYVPDRILVSTLLDDGSRVFDLVRDVAEQFGWTLTPDKSFDAGRLELDERERGERLSRYPWASGPLGIERFIIEAKGQAAAPDAWRLLRGARLRETELAGGSLVGIGLDHILTVHRAPGDGSTGSGSFQSTPYHSTPYHSTPYHSTPYHSTPYHSTAGFDPATGAEPAGSYLAQGSGGRQPVAIVASAPPRTTSVKERVIVATLDTGMGAHPWLDRTRCDLTGLPAIGSTDAADDPESNPDLIGPLDGMTDVLSGHGTFIAGLIHQHAPDADIAPWRVVGPDGTIDESDVIAALLAIASLIGSAVDGAQYPALAIDVLSLSLGYYHETPEDSKIDITLAEVLLRIRRAGTVVVCSAGNDATARPMFPAAFGPWSSTPSAGVPWIAPDDSAAQDAAPLVSVGALNPNGTTALFSNTGPWVRCYAPGASVVSTVPLIDGGAQPIARTAAAGRKRETVDPDDYSAGFAVWSGTSFAAPVIAGRIAAALHGVEPRNGGRAGRVARAIEAAAKVVSEAS